MLYNRFNDFKKMFKFKILILIFIFVVVVYLVFFNYICCLFLLLFLVCMLLFIVAQCNLIYIYIIILHNSTTMMTTTSLHSTFKNTCFNFLRFCSMTNFTNNSWTIYHNFIIFSTFNMNQCIDGC